MSDQAGSSERAPRARLSDESPLRQSVPTPDRIAPQIGSERVLTVTRAGVTWEEPELPLTWWVETDQKLLDTAFGRAHTD